tara:strand:- start:2158 stop:3051 length:894 start_codon:yes stop_codon:yes gene_type:complete
LNPDSWLLPFAKGLMRTFLLVLFTFFALIFAQKITIAAKRAQNICAEHFQKLHHGPWRSALICGTSLRGEEDFENLKSLGLIHLMVVSGAHLMFLDRWLRWLLRPSLPGHVFLKQGVLFVYGFFAGLQAPLLRSFFSNGPGKSVSLRLILGGLLTFLFLRQWTLSLSLSWTATLLVQWPHSKKLHGGIHSLLIALGLCPLLLSLGRPFIGAALFQPLFSMYFGGILFPMTFLGTVLPLEPLLNAIWKIFFFSLKLGEQFPLSKSMSENSVAWNVLYTLMLQFFFWRAEVKLRRRNSW